MLMAGLVIVSVGCVLLLTPYVLFPLLCVCLGRGSRPLHVTSSEDIARPFVSIVIPAYNEAGLIESKVRNTLSLRYPPHLFEVIVCNDGSTDDTAERLAHLARYGDIEVIHHEQNKGKASTLNTLFAAAQGEIAIVTDASASLDRDAITVLVDALDDPGVGMAQVGYYAQGADSQRWQTARWLRQQMSRSGMLIGLHGACFACRPAEVDMLPPDTINDDYVLPLLTRASGREVVHVARSGAYECVADQNTSRAARWRRIARGNAQMLWRYKRLCLPWRGRLAAAFVLHKGLKTLGPVWIAMMLVGYLSIMCSSIMALQMATGTLLLGLSTLLMSPRLFAFAKLAGLAQWSVACGLLDALRGQHTPWSEDTSTLNQTSQSMSFDRPAPVPAHISALKRAFDVCCAVVGLLVGAPIMACVAALIKLDDGGPVIYRQRRVCRVVNGVESTFEMMKFRTMSTDAESKSGPTWAVDHDERITRAGRWLRRMRLDELPQLWHVLTGEMSIVGPRPERPHFTSQLQREIAFYDDRLISMKPGITGLAQIYCGYDTSVDSVRNKIRYDLLYNAHLYKVRHYITMELRIAIQTVGVALTGRGAK